LTNPIWNSFVRIKEIAEASAIEMVDDKVDALLSAGIEVIADALPTGAVGLLREGASVAKAALDAHAARVTVDDRSPDYLAGRLAAAVDVLGYAAHQTEDEAILEVAKAAPYSLLMSELGKGPLRNVDLATLLGKDEGQISKWLTKLREHGAVVSHKQGRDTFNALSPVGRLVLDKGVEDLRRAPLAASNLASLDANRYDLNSRAPPLDAQPRELDRISAAPLAANG
jgi:DNA-binding transcriptional ArsR family regulator